MPDTPEPYAPSTAALAGAPADAAPPKKRSRTDEEEYLTRSRERFRLAADAESELRKLGLKDDDFRAGNHWPAEIKNRRDADGRPCLTIDKLSQPIRMVTNRERQARPAIQINPVGDGADQATAEIVQGLIRQIEAQSYADVAYDWAFDGAVSRGWGYFRVLTEYESDESFDQEIKIEWIENPYTVYFDPASRHWNRSDARWCHIVQDLTGEEYDARFGKGKAAAGLQAFQSQGDEVGRWFPSGSVRLAEYFHVEDRPATLVKLATGESLTLAAGATVPDDLAVVQTREVKQRVVKWCLHSATEILEEREWAGKFIPVIEVEGERLVTNGQRTKRGLVRAAIDPQRMYDYWVSTATEVTALAPRAPWLMYEGQDAGYESMWANANTQAYSSLKFRGKTTATGDQILPPPSRNTVEPPIQAIMIGIKQADLDLRSVTAFYDASDPSRPDAEQSGRAILARREQGSETNANFLANFSRSLRYLGEILLDLLPKIYDRPGRVVQILSLDDEVRAVILGQPFEAGADGQPQPAGPLGQPPPPGMGSAPPAPGTPMPQQAAPGGGGEPPIAGAPPGTLLKGLAEFYDLSKGRYSVTVSVGASYTTRRQEAVSSMLELIQAAPQIAPAAADILVKNMDWPGAPQLAERLKKMLPPELQENKQGQGPTPEQMQQQLQALGQQHEALIKVVEEQTTMLKTDAAKVASEERIKAADRDSRERIALVNAQTQRLIAAEKIEGDAQVESLRASVGELRVKLAALGVRPGLDPSLVMNEPPGQNNGQGAEAPAPADEAAPTDQY